MTTTITKYYYLNGMRVAQARKVGEAEWAFTWNHTDHLQSATRLTDSDGAEVRRLAYAAFGEEAENSGSVDAPTYTYTGKEQDASGLMYYGARYYDPALSRFITPDTLYDAGPQGLNRYSYALNNPIVYRDPTGHYINGPDDDENPECDGCVTGPIGNGGDEMVYHENDDDPSSLHSGSSSLNPTGSHRVMPLQSMINLKGMTKDPPTYAEQQRGLERLGAILHIVLATANEPYDWGRMMYGWTQGEFSYWSLAGLFPMVSGSGARKIGTVVENFFTKNRVAAYAFAVSSEFISNFTSKTRRFDAVKYGEYLEADTILLGRFYRDSLGRLDDFGQGLVPHATVLSARIGYGKHMVRNIQRVIDQTHHIYIRTEEVYKGLDKLSFTYRHELGYILKNKQLIDKTITFAEDGSELLLETWAQGKGLLK